jgi:DNA-directed RNA polymerase specialized sigma24 family protein
MSAPDAELPDAALVVGCLVGDDQAWRLLYERHQPKLLARVATMIGSVATRAGQAEEIATDVWYSLFIRDSHRLRVFNPERGNFSTFLTALARQQIRLAWRRAGHSPRPSVLPDDIADGRGELLRIGGVLWDEFLDTLSIAERRFLHEQLLGQSSSCVASDTSAGSSRKLKQRVLAKMRAFLD